MQKNVLAVRHPRELHAKHARRREGVVDVPARAGGAEAGDVDARGREALRNVAGDVDADEVERARLRRPAGGAWSGGGRPARRRRRSGSSGCRRRSGSLFAASRKMLIGHQDRAGEVVGERGAQSARSPPRSRSCPAATIASRTIVMAEIGDLVGDLEQAARRRQHLGNLQPPRELVVAARAALHQVGGRISTSTE